MKRFFTSLFAVVIIVCGFVTVSAAQKAEPDTRVSHEKIRAMMAWKLIDYLNLNEEQSSKLLPLMKETNEARDKLMKERRGIISKISDNIDDSSVSIKDLKKDVGKLEKIREEMIEKRKEFLKKSEKFLDERQYIKLMIFEDRLKADLFRRYRGRRKEDHGEANPGIHEKRESSRQQKE